MTQKPEYLRPEAKPLTWSELDPSQQTALATLIAILNEALPDREQPIPKPERTPWLDYDRKVRVALLSGQRGTGKTTVLLSLRRAFNEGSFTGEDIPADLQQNFTRLRDRLIWLEHLDMSSLPASTNLFAAILARLDMRLERRVPADAQAGPITTEEEGDILEPSATYHGALAKFSRLQNDVALAWEGNLAQRAGSLDPSQYAMEVMRAEHVRLSLNERLSNVLDRLAEHSLRGEPVRDPLFVMPIDDFDLNPIHCLDLLDLLRIISVRRLFFLVLGDLQMAELICTVKLAGDMVKLAANPSAVPFLPPAIQVELAAHNLRAAGNRLRKLLPPSQRVELNVPDLRKALEYRPPGKENEPLLRELLDKSPIPLSPIAWKSKRISNRNIKTLTDFLLAPPLNVRRSREAVPAGNDQRTPAPVRNLLEHRIAGAFYHARFFLEAPFRILADYWFSFHNIIATPSTTSAERVEDRIIKVLFTHFRNAVIAEPALATGQWRDLTDQVFVDPAGNWSIPIGNMNIGAALASSGKLSMTEKRGRFTGIRNLNISSLENHKQPWNIGPSATHVILSSSPVGQAAVLPTGVPAHVSPFVERMMILYTDLQTLNSPYAKRNTLLPADLNAYRFAVGEWIEGTHIVEWPWPFPPVGTYWEYELFLNAWGSAANLVVGSQRRDLATNLAFAWIDVAIAVLKGDQPLGVPDFGNPTKQDWALIGERLVGLLNESVGGGPASVDLREWMAQLPTILGPEWLGESRDVWNVLSAKKSLVDFWRVNGARLVEQMRERFRQQQFKELVNWATSIRVPWAEPTIGARRTKQR